jgi:hypothetical protein
MKWIRSNALSIFFLLILLATMIGQALAGARVFNDEALQHGEVAISTLTYVKGPVFWSHVMENWQSEFLQFTMFIATTIYLVQKGSSESKKEGAEGTGDEPRRKVHWLYANSLVIVPTLIFFATWGAQSLTSLREYNMDQHAHHAAAIGWSAYIQSADFWERSLQNWQSEFLAVGSMVVFSIYLRQIGSPESKKLTAPNDENGPTY